MKQLSYLEKLMQSVAIIVAEAAGVTVEEDELTLAILFIRNHLTATVNSRVKPDNSGGSLPF